MSMSLTGPARLAAILALLTAARPASGFIRSTSAALNPTQGTCLAWAPHQLTYKVNASGLALPAGVGGCTSEQAAIDLINQSVPTWRSATRTGESQPCTDFTFVNGGTSGVMAVGNDGINLVVIRQGLCSVRAVGDPCLSTPGACAAKFNCWEHSGSTSGILALTTTTFNVNTGEILDADMELAGWDGTLAGALPTTLGTNGWYETCAANVPVCHNYGDTGCAYIDIGVVVTHEAGHMLGLDHPCQYDTAHGGSFASVPVSTCVVGAVMQPNYTADTFAKRQLTQDDVAAVCSIYRPGEVSDQKIGCLGSGAQALSNSSSSSGGCSAGGGGALSLIGLGLGLLRRRGRHLVRSRRA
jgi:hypothetical protein